MRQLVFLRHGQAGTAATDAERPLTELGRSQAEQSAKRLAQEGFVPDIIISSPYKRAMETAEIARNIISNGKKTPIIEENSIAAQDFDAVIASIYAALAEYGNILVVGHVPIFEEIPYNLCGEAPRMKTGSFAWLEIDGILPAQRKNNRLRENFIPGVSAI